MVYIMYIIFWFSIVVAEAKWSGDVLNNVFRLILSSAPEQFKPPLGQAGVIPFQGHLMISIKDKATVAAWAFT